jgi:C4-dicarboxylate transporter DctQ subunit
MHKINLEMQDMTIKKWAAHSILVIGFGLLFFRFLQLLWKMIKGDEIGFHLADEAQDALDELALGDTPEGKGDTR